MAVLLVLLLDLVRTLSTPASDLPLIYFWGRYETRCAAHLAMTAFKLEGRRASYEAMRSLIVTINERDIPSFDEFGVGITVCDLPICITASDFMLEVNLSPANHGGSSAARGWPDGAEGLEKNEHVCQVEERHHSPRPPLLPASTLPSGKNHDTASLPARRADSSTSTSSTSATTTTGSNGQGEVDEGRKRPIVVVGLAAADKEERTCLAEEQPPVDMSAPEVAWPARHERPGSVVRVFSHDGGGGGGGGGGGSERDSGVGLERVDEQQQRQQRDRRDVDARSRKVRGAGLGLGRVEQARGAAVGVGPRYSSTDASELGLMDGLLGGGRGWAGQRVDAGCAGNHASGAALGEGRAGGDGVANRCRYPSLDSQQPHERSDRLAPFFSGHVGPGAGLSCTGVPAKRQHHHHSELRQDREARSTGVAAAGGAYPCVPDDHQHILSRSTPQSAGAAAAGSFVPEIVPYPPKLVGYPRRCEAEQEDGMMGRNNNSDMAVMGGSGANRGSGGCVGPSHEFQRRNGAQPLSDGGGQRGGAGQRAVEGSSDLSGLLLDDS